MRRSAALGPLPHRRPSAQASDGGQNSVRVGEFPRGLLGIDVLAIDADFKHSAAARDQGQGSDVMLELQ
jgi:hypothetical protein